MQISQMTTRLRKKMRMVTEHVSIRTRVLISAIAATALVAGGVGASAFGVDNSSGGPFLKSGTNGFPSPNAGAAVVVNEGHDGKGALLTSISGGTNQAGFGLVGLKGGQGAPSTFGGLTDVETQYDLTQGTCVGGAPRWAFDLRNPTNSSQTASILVYFGTQPFGGCSGGAQQEPNVFSPSSNTTWFVNNSNTPQTTSQVEATYGSWILIDLEAIVDAGWAQGTQLNPNIQQVLLQKFKVNSKTFFPLPEGA
jgi:hypothetical protein